MTDTSYPPSALSGHNYGLPLLRQNGPVGGQPHPSPPIHEAPAEDDGLISCICGFPDDDGMTVQCDQCKRWQHQLCYYPEYEDRNLPETLDHYCLDCSPRDFDLLNARLRQQTKRANMASDVNGGKRPGSKSHKKKVKEPGYANGWPLDKSRHDRNSASPRDQPPPAKRPKTSHRPSDSVASAKGHSRKRNMSNANHRRSISQSPDVPQDLYSDHFLRCYAEDDWTVSDSNLHASTDVRNALSNWLTASEDDFREMHGCDKRDVMSRWDGELDAIPNKAQIEIRLDTDDRYSDESGTHPTWKWVTVQEPIAEGAYIGELKGYVGFKEDYIQDPANRWPLLRHPEPFVFFHPRLPIYIDARNEGTELRYIRRSCVPNAKLSVLVTEATDYHFCFMATQQIDPGMEIAVAWDTWDSVPTLQGNNKMSDTDLKHLGSWVSKVLANCGPCACQLSGDRCSMARFDHRTVDGLNDNEPQAPKALKAKRKKATRHISPLNTNVNSRSGSEVRRVGADDEPSDSRSPSASAGRDSASRDITPNIHYQHAGSTAAKTEMSERERRKLEKEEAMFKRQEEERSGKGGKKKRNSGGSNLSTPNASTSKQLGFGPTSSRYADAGTTKQSGLPSAKGGRRAKSSTQKSPALSATKGIKRPKVDYASSAVQCDMDQEEEDQRARIVLPHRAVMSTTQRLLQRCALNNARLKGSAALAAAEKLIKMENSAAAAIPAAPLNDVPMKMDLDVDIAQENDNELKDAEMEDANPETAVSLVTPAAPAAQLNHELHSAAATEAPEQPTDPSAPPWSTSDHPQPTLITPTEPKIDDPLKPPSPENNIHPHKSPEMHLTMPPPPANPFSTTAPPSANHPGSGLPFAQSPISLAPGLSPSSNPMFSPSVNAAVGPSPAKKKLSLSDYTRRKAKVQDVPSLPGGGSEVKSERESSPASVASGPIGGGSTVTAADEAGKEDSAAVNNESAVVDDGEDVKMEDAVPVIATGEIVAAPAAEAAPVSEVEA